ncbi:ABC-type Fe3+-hydroxamate transport system, substrate-binding protein [Algoriphagus ornithinivorans]|uniref:ABC-type Fe3+-hydroxamate transport system, substrate-binding protein n=1 Tax=Algoriphagus ornithinivorans TaxID=226506 RepID=A0A1I5FFW2_9BACT|nr:helical backbone metal receptor [Algoriphagus ornithinivorans]SFO22582.1 ABC-type Fe3+-hydroxamate transport system, substrate-binding protein [Algoriphagus ornithinivorans]
MEFTDQLNRTIFLPHPPKRIVSLVPSQTELLVDLDLEDRIVGVTKFCIHPKGLKKSKAIVGGTKNYRFEVIEELKPDLIIGNKEENDQKGIEKLAERFPIWMSDIFKVSDALEMIRSIGELTGSQEKAEELSIQISKEFLKPMPGKGRAVYLIWNKPMMAAGRNTFIDEMLRYAGFENVVAQDRYPELSIEEIKGLDPEWILLSSEPFPFKEKHIKEFEGLFPKKKIKIVDGEMFSWYGSRLLKSKRYFQSL